MKKDDLIENWLDLETSAEEREEMGKIIALTSQMETPATKSTSMAWDELMDNIDTSEDNERLLTPEKKTKIRWFLYAASLAAVLLAGYFSLFQENSGATVSFETASAEIQNQTLPDLSEVTLNANSSLTYSTEQWDEERNLNLEGEAFFEVTKGRTFTVNTDLGQVTVLGTSFNVYNRDTDLTVSCFTGSVKVNTNNDQVILSPGQQARIEPRSNRLRVESFNPQQSATWRIGEFYFDGVALTKVIDELERQFDIKVEVNGNISDRFYSGFFSTKSLSEALQLVFVPMGLNSQVNDNIVTIE